MGNRQRMWIGVTAIVVVIALVYFLFFRDDRAQRAEEVRKQVEQRGEDLQQTLNPEDISPISGLACENKDKRSVAVMQPAEKTARPAAGFSEADMVFEMFSFTIAQVRLMGVYQCVVPTDIGSIRSARHDYIHLAKGLDAAFVHWGYSKFAEELLKKGVIDNINCMTTSFCPRWPQTGIMKMEDTGRIPGENISKAMESLGYRQENQFVGYPHRSEVPLELRPTGGRLRIAFPAPNDVKYDYDPETNAFLRTWGGTADIDKNNGKRVSPKNVVVMVAESEQINLARDGEYRSHNVGSPWDLIPEEERAGINGVPGAPEMGRYNDVQIGDPWFDWVNSGEAYFYIEGKQTRGTWKKDTGSADSRLFFYDEAGVEVQFIPGQIWVEVIKPGIGQKWEAVAEEGVAME